MANVLAQVEALINELDYDRRKKYISKIASIKERLQYEEMRLALIGNFSCGKSTFINALLKEPLLAVANMPTTAIPTYIDWNSDKKTKIAVTDTHGESHPMGFQTKIWLKRETGIQPPSERGQLIDYLTTTNTLHDIVSDVHISYPSISGYPGFCIIDTPGVNPGAEESANHILQTQMVLRNEADAAIILFPCYNVYTRAFREFLEENASHIIENSIFIITKMDQVPTEQERTKLISFVKAHLQNDFFLENPEVYGCSAGCAVDSYTQKNNDAKYSKWASEFEYMMNSIFKSLEGRRKKIIDERVQQMIQMLMSDLAESISEQELTLCGDIAEIEKGTAKALEQQFGNSLSVYQNTVKQKTNLICSECASEIHEKIAAIKNEINNNIFDTKSILNLNSVLGNIISSVPKNLRQWMRETIRGKLETTKETNLNEYKTFVSQIDTMLISYNFHVGKIRNWMNQMNRYKVNRNDLTVEVKLQSPNIGAWPGIIVLLMVTIIGFPIALIVNACVDVTKHQCSAWSSLSDQLDHIEKDLKEYSAMIISKQCDVFFDAAKPILNDYRSKFKNKFEKRANVVETNLSDVRNQLEQNKKRMAKLNQLISEYEKEQTVKGW